MICKLIASILVLSTVILAVIEIAKKELNYSIKSCSSRLCITSFAIIFQFIATCIGVYNKHWVGPVIIFMGYILYMAIQTINLKLLIDQKLTNK